MTEIDERTLGSADAEARYPGDPTSYVPPVTTPSGMHIGRNLPGLMPATDMWGGALHVFLSGLHDDWLAPWESAIRRFCDHTQVHPGLLHTDSVAQAIVGRGYWIRADIENLESLAQNLSRASATAPVLMLPRDPATPFVHARIVIPFRKLPARPGESPAVRVGDSILSLSEREWLMRAMLPAGAALEHLDFNGTHLSVTGLDSDIASVLESVQSRFECSDFHNMGMTAFTSDKVNVESYPVEYLP